MMGYVPVEHCSRTKAPGSNTRREPYPSRHRTGTSDRLIPSAVREGEPEKVEANVEVAAFVRLTCL
jgi:hypothetical protein